MGSKKTAEDKVFKHIISAGYPEPMRQMLLIPKRKFRADFYWPSLRAVLEVEGGVYTRGRHVRPSGFISDIKKYNLYAYHGYTLYRIIPQDVGNGYLDEVLEMIFGI